MTPILHDSALTSDPGLPRDAYALLAQANLLRMRGCWPDAVEKCMEAMRLAPDNATAQSLLGDIYENQGRTDDAVQWYRMALDVNPDSPADRVKLERLLQAKSLPAAGPPAANSPMPRRTPRWQEPDTLLRMASLAAGLLVLTIVTLALMATAQRGHTGQTRQINSPPVVLPAAETPPLASEPPVSAAAVVLHDPAEQRLLERMQAEFSSELTLTGLESDPRAARLTLTLALKPQSSGTPTRDAVLQAMLRAAQAAVRETDSQTAALLTVRCLIAPADGAGTPSSPLVFVGDLPRAAVPSVSPDLTPVPAETLAALFQNPWWSPLLPR